MTRYRFPLAAVLRVRRAEEDGARHRLARANGRLAAAERTLAGERARCASPPAAARLDAAGFGHDRLLADLAGRRAAAALVARDAARADAAACLAAWQGAATAVAALERLDERRRAEWQAEELRREAAVLDDLTGARAAAVAGPTRRGGPA